MMMMQAHTMHPILLMLATLLLLASFANAWTDEAADLLAKGDTALSQKKLEQSIEYYREGILALPERWSNEKYFDRAEGIVLDEEMVELPNAKEMEVILSLHTNHGTAMSYLQGNTEEVQSAFRTSCLCFREWQKLNGVDNDNTPNDLKDIAAQSYFFLGMTNQDMAPTEKNEEDQQMRLQVAVRTYAQSGKIDPNHWSSWANMAAVLADVGTDSISLGLYDESILAYQKAIGILTGAALEEGQRPTDPPENVREVIAELHYRVGLCLVPFLFNPKLVEEYDGDISKKMCTLAVGPEATPTTRSCLELGSYQFQTALQFHAQHDGAANTLAFATADATFGMSTDTEKVKKLFEEYAPTFEESLVDELGYNAFDRMRQGFDRAMVSEGLSEKVFPLVLDAGCGTGLAGEVFQNISQALIGVDLSQTIIDLAKKSRPDVYTKFKTGDVKEILQQYKQRISLVVAADTFIYFNDLNELFSAIETGLEEGGYTVFTLENVSDDNESRLNQIKPDWRWQLQPSGRVAHRKEFVETVAKQHSLDTIQYEQLDQFREESGVGVRGHMFVLKKRTVHREEL